MKYTVTIGGRSFDNISDQKTTPSFRSESSSKNLGGELLIDRTGDEKTELKITAGGLSESEMNTLVSYYNGNTLVTKTMHFNVFTEPAPYYFYGDKNKGMIYPNVTLSFSEV